MSKTKESGSAAVAVHPDTASNPDPATGGPASRPAGTATGAAGGHAIGEVLDPAVEKDYWHVNHMTRPYYRQGRSFGDYEAAYRYGWENASKAGRMTFEEAERAYLAAGWTAVRGEAHFPWEEVREATRDAWNRARRHPGA